ncbi:MAG: outer membrane protein assembly factor BamD [Planctomycetes bacterium]|nr:outer membrane protein assembly factor BamD [Planctomycetota bacterium]
MKRTRTLSLAAMLVAVVMSAPLAAGDGPPARAERLRFDSRTESWIALPRPEPGTAAGDLAIARSLFADGAYKKAKKAAGKWLNRYGDEHEEYPAAVLLLAQAKKARRNYHAAHETLQELLSDFRGTGYAEEALVEDFNIAEVFLSGVRRKLWGMRLLKADETGLEILDRISTDYDGTAIAEKAIKTKADYFYRRGDFSLAELEYARLVREFPQSRYTRYAMRRSADAALASFGGVCFDDAPLIEAEERFKLYMERFPGAAQQEGVGLRLNEIREKRAAKELEIGRYYERAKQHAAAVFYYRSAMENWPESIAANKAASALESISDFTESGEVEPVEGGAAG